MFGLNQIYVDDNDEDEEDDSVEEDTFGHNV